MKKTLFITLLAVIAILACACGGSSSRNEVLDKTPEEIINHIYATAEKTEVLENINEYAAIQEITPEMSYWFLGTEGIPFEVGTASEPLMSPANYSFCIVKIKEGKKVSA